MPGKSRLKIRPDLILCHLDIGGSPLDDLQQRGPKHASLSVTQRAV